MIASIEWPLKRSISQNEIACSRSLSTSFLCRFSLSLSLRECVLVSPFAALRFAHSLLLQTVCRNVPILVGSLRMHLHKAVILCANLYKLIRRFCVLHFHFPFFQSLLLHCRDPCCPNETCMQRTQSHKNVIFPLWVIIICAVNDKYTYSNSTLSLVRTANICCKPTTSLSSGLRAVSRTLSDRAA